MFTVSQDLNVEVHAIRLISQPKRSGFLIKNPDIITTNYPENEKKSRILSQCSPSLRSSSLYRSTFMEKTKSN